MNAHRNRIDTLQSPQILQQAYINFFQLNRIRKFEYHLLRNKKGTEPGLEMKQLHIF